MKITALNQDKISTLIRILSNHNNLNYHMTRAKLRYNEYCDFCTEVMKHADNQWQENCLETAHHILCRCHFFNNKRKDIFNKYQINNINEVCKANINQIIENMIKYFHDIKIFERTPTITKRSLSPNRILPHNFKKRKNNSSYGNKTKRPRRL